MKSLPLIAAFAAAFTVSGAFADELLLPNNPVAAQADMRLPSQTTATPAARPAFRTSAPKRIARNRVLKPRVVLASEQVQVSSQRRVLRQPGPILVGAFF